MKKKSKKFLFRRIVAVLFIILLIFGIRKVGYYFWCNNQKREVRILLNHEMVSLINHVYVKDSILYVSQEDIKKMFDETIDYDSEDEKLITTCNKHIAVLDLNENYMLLNDVSFPMKGKLQEINAKLYLPLSDLETVYDIEVTYSEKTNIAMIDSTNKAKKQVMALKNAKIKASKLPFAITIEKVKRGDKLESLEQNGKYQKVRTSLRKYRVYSN